MRWHVVLAVLVAARGVDGVGSVWWEYWQEGSNCNNSEGEVHSDWTLDSECMQGSKLKEADPLNFLGGGLDVDIRCHDPEGGSNRVASDDVALVSWYNTSNGTCGGQAWRAVDILSSECGPEPATMLRVHCTRCKWFFREAASPPYFLQAVGVLVFLTACIAFNLVFQQKLDHCAKVLPPKLCGCLFADEGEKEKNKKKKTRHRPVKDSLVEVVENISMYTALDEVQPKQESVQSDNEANDEAAFLGLSGVSFGKTPSGNLKRQRRMSRFRDTQKIGDLLNPGSTPLGSSVTSQTTPLSASKRRQSTKKLATGGSGGGSVSNTNNPLSTAFFEAEPLPVAATPRRTLHQQRKGSSRLSRTPSGKDLVDVVSEVEELLVASPKRVRKPSSRHMTRTPSANFKRGPRSTTTTGDIALVEDVYLVHASPPPIQFDETVVDIYDEHAVQQLVGEDNPFTPLFIPDEDLGPMEECKFCACQLLGHDCDDWISKATRGEFGRIARVDRATPTRTLVSFLRPITSEPEADVWRDLCRIKGFVVVREKTVEKEKTVELEGNVCVWLDSANVEWKSNCGSFVRVIEEPWTKAGDHWKDWYKDFQLCVGEVVTATKTEDGEIILGVTFLHSALLTLPMECFKPSTEEMYNAEALIIPQPMERRVMMAVFVASTPPLLSLKAVFLVAMFCYAIYNVLQEGHRGKAAHHSSWEGYEEVYFKLFNSGYPSLMADCSTLTSYFLINFRPSRKSFVRGVGLPSTIVLVITTVVSLPGIITHALPMAVYYGWLWAPLFFIVYHATKVIIRYRPSPPVIDMNDAYSMSAIWKHHRGYIIKAATYYLFFRFAAECVGVIFLQTNYNYGVLAYDGAPYFHTIVQEFEQREFLCIWEMGMRFAAMI